VSLHSDQLHAPRPQEQAISSPCKNQCRLNSAQICEGCGRSLQQIENWWHYSQDQRKEIMAALVKTKA